jgi:hypothetical protein
MAAKFVGSSDRELIEPDEESRVNVEHDYPKATDVHKYRLMPADTMLRQQGYKRQPDGTYEKDSI